MVKVGQIDAKNKSQLVILINSDGPRDFDNKGLSDFSHFFANIQQYVRKITGCSPIKVYIFGKNRPSAFQKYIHDIGYWKLLTRAVVINIAQ